VIHERYTCEGVTNFYQELFLFHFCRYMLLSLLIMMRLELMGRLVLIVQVMLMA